MAENGSPSREMQEDLLKFAQAKYMSSQEKYNAIQTLAKKYNMPLEQMIKKIVMEWMIDDKNQKFSNAGKKAPFKKVL
jgi:1-aminocyclopropane-1-carboxylate deaminase/D-cysteine desulfhydrase-like pyridoxal-dependent ACC family enzyme